MRAYNYLIVILAGFLLIGCQAYKRDIMLQFDEKFDAGKVEKSVDRVAENYVIQKGDLIRFDVFTNDGEQLALPNFDLGLDGGSANNQQIVQVKERFTYLVLEDGTCRFPKVGRIAVAGLTIDEAEELLEENYNEYYKESFVKIRPANRRVIVLGAIGAGQGGNQTGSGGQVIPLDNENVTILEVLALAGGIQQGGRVESIRLIRGDLQNPKVFEINLQTISGMQQGGMIVESGDIIYVEPWRRPFRETLRDITPALSLATSVTTLIFVVQNSNRN